MDITERHQAEEALRRRLELGIELKMVLAGGLWATLCDANQLGSAILSLTINARAQGGEVRPGQHIAVSVTDTGTAPEVLAKALDPSFTKPTGQGTGLGLAMLYGFVKQSQGHVRIHSELGRGTTFKLYLLRHRGRADGSIGGEAGETVLVVEGEARAGSA